MARHFQEHGRSEIASISELDAHGPAVGAGLNHVSADFGIWMMEDRNHSLIDHRRQNCHTIFSHSDLHADKSQSTPAAGGRQAAGPDLSRNSSGVCSGGAMNSGPTGSRMDLATMASISVRASLSSFQPITS